MCQSWQVICKEPWTTLLCSLQVRKSDLRSTKSLSLFSFIQGGQVTECGAVCCSRAAAFPRVFLVTVSTFQHSMCRAEHKAWQYTIMAASLLKKTSLLTFSWHYWFFCGSFYCRSISFGRKRNAFSKHSYSCCISELLLVGTSSLNVHKLSQRTRSTEGRFKVSHLTRTY